MPNLDWLSGSTDGTSISTATLQKIPVHRPLLRALSAAGVTKCGDVDKITHEKMGRLLENKTPSERIMLKDQLRAAGIYPRDVNAVRPLNIFAGR